MEALIGAIAVLAALVAGVVGFAFGRRRPPAAPPADQVDWERRAALEAERAELRAERDAERALEREERKARDAKTTEEVKRAHEGDIVEWMEDQYGDRVRARRRGDPGAGGG